MISIIIPAYNESEIIERLVKHLLQQAPKGKVEVIVSDGGSKDSTLLNASKAGAKALLSPQKGRAVQMNYGASFAKGDILYFVHADTLPPESYYEDILKAVASRYDAGRYIMRFDTRKWYLRFNEFFTRFDWFICYGGDQTLYVTRKFFDITGGFNGEMQIMEDYDFTLRLLKAGSRYKIFKKSVLISDRKYNMNSWWQVQRANSRIVSMYKKGASQEDMTSTYKQMLNYR